MKSGGGPTMDLFSWMALSSLIGGVGYAISAWRKKSAWGFIAGEAFFSAGFCAGAIHLAYYAAMNPDKLFEIHMVGGTELDLAKVKVTIDSLHRFEIFVGGLIGALGSARSVWSAWSKPLH
jgi:hypothetical protein